MLVSLAIVVPFFSFACLKNFKKIISGSANVVLRICQGFWKSDELFVIFVTFFFFYSIICRFILIIPCLLLRQNIEKRRPCYVFYRLDNLNE